MKDVDMEVKIDGVVYESEAARYLCDGCVARHDIGLCADVNENFPCTDFIWIRKELIDTSKDVSVETTSLPNMNPRKINDINKRNKE